MNVLITVGIFLKIAALVICQKKEKEPMEQEEFIEKKNTAMESSEDLFGWWPETEKIKKALCKSEFIFVKNLEKKSENGKAKNTRNIQAVIMRERDLPDTDYFINKRGIRIDSMVEHKRPKMENAPYETVVINMKGKIDKKEILKVNDAAVYYICNGYISYSYSAKRYMEAGINVNIYDWIIQRLEDPAWANTDLHVLISSAEKDKKFLSFLCKSKAYSKLSEISERKYTHEKIIEKIKKEIEKEKKIMKKEMGLEEKKIDKEEDERMKKTRSSWMLIPEYKVLSMFLGYDLEVMKEILEEAIKMFEKEDCDREIAGSSTMYNMDEFIKAVDDINKLARWLSKCVEVWDYPMIARYIESNGENSPEILIQYRCANGSFSKKIVPINSDNIEAIIQAETIEDVDKIKIEKEEVEKKTLLQRIGSIFR